MELNKSSSSDKSRSSSITETEDTVEPQNKTRSISSASLYDKDTKEQQPKERMIRNEKLRSDNTSVSSMSVHASSITTVSPEKHRIHWKNKNKKLSENLITGNKITQEPDNPSKKQNWIVSLMKQNLI